MIACDCYVCSSPHKEDNRLRSSILVESDTTSFVVDTTPDFRYQMLRCNNRKLDAVLYTHAHKDHIAGMDDIRAYNFSQKKPIEVYANASTQEALRREFYYVFLDNKYPGVPQINVHEIDDQPFMIGDIPIHPILVWHLNMQVLGFRIGNFTYITDANRIAEAEKEKIKGSEVLVLNALRKEKHVSHFTLEEAVDLAIELEVPRVYFTHMSHQLGRHQEINQILPQHIQLAYDGLVIQMHP